MKKPYERTKPKVLPLDEVLVSRRGFCQLLGVGAAASTLTTLSACGTANSTDDAGDNSSPDLTPAATSPDMAHAAGDICPAGLSDTGMTPDTFALNTATFFDSDHVFVCRDAGGLFALTSICTHEGCDVIFAANRFSCPCHLSRFSFIGAVTRGPATTPLDHYRVCLVNGTTVGYDNNSAPVDSTVRYKF